MSLVPQAPRLIKKKLKSHVFHIRVSGCVQGIAHNAAGTLVGVVFAGIDCVFNQRLVVKYDGGINAREFVLLITLKRLPILL